MSLTKCCTSPSELTCSRYVFRALVYLYPFGASVNVVKPAVPLLSTGSVAFPGNRPVRTTDVMFLVPVLLNGLWVFCGLTEVTYCCDRVARFVTRYLPASRGRAVLYFTNAKTCDGRESNPGQLLGRQLCSPLYHHRWAVVRLGDCNAVDFLTSRSVCSVSFE